MAAFGFETTGDEVVEAFPGQVKGKTFLITGPSPASLGSETAVTLARGGPAALILLGRDIAKVQPVIDAIKSIDEKIVVKFVPVQLDSQKSVREAAKTILDDAEIRTIDVIICNAGIMAAPFALTPEGVERQFATNHLGHFLLVNRLLKGGKAGKRIVTVSSYGNVFSDVLDDPNFDAGKIYDPFKAYGQSKTANVLMAVAINEKLGSSGVKAFSINPGSIPTDLRRFMNPQAMEAGMALHKQFGITPPARKTLQQGVSTTLRAALDPDLSIENESIFLHDCNPTTDPKVVASYSLDKVNAERCWNLSEKLSGEAFEY